MTVVACALAALALIDGACSGFRSSLGRTGLVRHRSPDRNAAFRGTVLVALLLLPTAVIAMAGLGSGDVTEAQLQSAGEGLLIVLVPYGAVVAAALIAYGLLGWRQKYIAMALVLGPFTLIRPAVVIAAAIAACFACHSWIPSVAVAASVVAILAVEPLTGACWRERDHYARL